jgi:hypothetical protein
MRYFSEIAHNVVIFFLKQKWFSKQRNKKFLLKTTKIKKGGQVRLTGSLEHGHWSDKKIKNSEQF